MAFKGNAELLFFKKMEVDLRSKIPLCYPGLAREWPAVELWNKEYLSKLEEGEVRVWKQKTAGELGSGPFVMKMGEFLAGMEQEFINHSINVHLNNKVWRKKKKIILLATFPSKPSIHPCKRMLLILVVKYLEIQGICGLEKVLLSSFFLSVFLLLQ